jgi:hypothetical protein
MRLVFLKHSYHRVGDFEKQLWTLFGVSSP